MNKFIVAGVVGAVAIVGTVVSTVIVRKVREALVEIDLEEANSFASTFEENVVHPQLFKTRKGE